MQNKNIRTKEPIVPRTRRLIINDESIVYHAWDVETKLLFTPRLNSTLP